ncbi:MAG: acetoin utilization protein AcuC [Alphaproteobacteria bacterium]|nr:MAG: acetoin utilization protein AcuC [Alphaproteobacteria bacterium]
MHRHVAPWLVGAEIYRRSSYGAAHPLAIPRVSSTVDLITALGWREDSRWRTAPLARPDQLMAYHDPTYIRAVQRAEARRRVATADRDRYQVGINGNPVFAEVYRRPATSAGATLAAIDWLAETSLIHSLPGGTHHGMADRAAGFCYFNDAVLAIRKALARGLAPVAYIDFDAHHGDGVESGVGCDPRVLCLSIHEAGRWPHTGMVLRPPGTQARNLPVPPGFNDSELAFLVDSVVIPLLQRWQPALVVVQAGCDALADDPMSGLSLSNQALWRAVAATVAAAPRAIVTGGGGYNPWAVARCWAGLWGTLDHQSTPARLPSPAEAVLRGLSWRHRLGRQPPEHWFTTLVDPPNHGPIRAEVRGLVAPSLA